MEYKTIQCHSLLNRITRKDTLFHGVYTIDPYQNCEYKCTYCDSSIEDIIYIKINAHQVLEKEIKQIPKGLIIVGSVHDPYQKAEEKYEITRDILKIIKKNNFPCQILTKSKLVLRDIDVLSKIKDCKVTISILGLNKSILNVFEKNVPNTRERLKTVETLSKNGIKTGIAIIPVLPYIIETELEKIIESAFKHKASYIIHKHLELKGDQKIYFMKTLEKYYPHLIHRYEELFKNRIIPKEKYISELKKLVNKYIEKYEISNKI